MVKTTNTGTHMGVDEKIKQGYSQRAMEEGFSAASGVRPETSSSGGRVLHPETKDGARHTGKVPNHLDEENEGLADN
jgi:hypothetical protein